MSLVCKQLNHSPPTRGTDRAAAPSPRRARVWLPRAAPGCHPAAASRARSRPASRQSPAPYDAESPSPEISYVNRPALCRHSDRRDGADRRGRPRCRRCETRRSRACRRAAPRPAAMASSGERLGKMPDECAIEGIGDRRIADLVTVGLAAGAEPRVKRLVGVLHRDDAHVGGQDARSTPSSASWRRG